jgi:acyl-coenzyme A thioesterase PaaI-like protein
LTVSRPDDVSLQDYYAPRNECFGCGPANPRGLRIKSWPKGDELVCDWVPEAHHKAFDNVLNGGICGTLLDCHSNWTAAYFLMKAKDASALPCTVTSEFSVKLLRPTPLLGRLHLIARPVELDGDRAVVEARIEADGKTTATCRGVFVAVTEGHPAYYRW